MPASDTIDKAPVVVVVGALAPYTQVLYEGLAARLGRPLRVLACSARETARQWTLDRARGYGFEVLPGLRWHRSSISNLYVNPSVILRLAALRPSAVILNDFSPTMAMAAATSRVLRIPYGIRTDGVPETDPGTRSAPHRLMRKALVGQAAFGLGPSEGSRQLLEAYGLARSDVAIAPLFPAWRPSRTPGAGERPHDVLFCGMLNEEVKGARFFTDVVLGCLDHGRRLDVRVVGEGPLRGEMEQRFAAAGLKARFDGFLQQDELAEAYASATVFHFPSRGDVWGVVVQEALQCGAVVLASPHSGAARELLAARHCGVVQDLDRAAWIAETLDLLDRPERRAALRAAADLALPDFAPQRAIDAYAEVLGRVISIG